MFKPKTVAIIRAKAFIALMSMLVGAFLLPQKASACDKQEILECVNAIRVENGLLPYEQSLEFSNLADIRAKEQALVYSHTRPDGSEWFTISPCINSENIARARNDSQAEADAVIEAWMMSSCHKANVLSKDSKSAGIGIYKDNNGVSYIVMLTD